MSILETGTGEGFLVKVNKNGQVEAQAAVTGEVTSNPCGAIANQASFDLLNESTTLLEVEQSRVEFRIQNQGSDAAYIHLGVDPATVEDWRIPAGGELRLERYIGVVNAVSTVDPGTTLLVWELVR